jgi:hypothetical protein
MTQARTFIEEALAIANEVERAQAICDLAFDAEQMAKTGRRAEAIELFELLATLDRHDDLLAPAIESADEHLVSLGVRTRPSLDGIVQGLRAKFEHLGEYQCLLSVAKTLVRDHGKRRKQVWKIAKDLLAAAEKIQPLGNKDLRFRAEVLQHAE